MTGKYNNRLRFKWLNLFDLIHLPFSHGEGGMCLENPLSLWERGGRISGRGEVKGDRTTFKGNPMLETVVITFY
jgi:hypothetical protein